MRLQVKRDASGNPLGMEIHMKWTHYGQSEPVTYSIGADPVDLPEEVAKVFFRVYAQYIEAAPIEPPVEPPKPPILPQVVAIQAEKPTLSRGRPKKG